MKLNNKNYDLGKWFVLIVLPALAVLIGGLAELYQWINGSVVVTTINLMTVFLGSILQISSGNYHSENDRWGGGVNDLKPH